MMFWCLKIVLTIIKKIADSDTKRIIFCKRLHTDLAEQTIE
jgi:hypothetical protein